MGNTYLDATVSRLINRYVELTIKKKQAAGKTIGSLLC
jgi:hypothetical protein